MLPKKESRMFGDLVLSNLSKELKINDEIKDEYKELLLEFKNKK